MPGAFWSFRSVICLEPACVLCHLCWLHLPFMLPPRLPLGLASLSQVLRVTSVVSLSSGRFFWHHSDWSYVKSYIFLWIQSKEGMRVKPCLLERGNPCFKPSLFSGLYARRVPFAPFWLHVSVQTPAELPAGPAVQDRPFRLPLAHTSPQAQETGKVMTEADNSKMQRWGWHFLGTTTLHAS